MFRILPAALVALLIGCGASSTPHNATGMTGRGTRTESVPNAAQALPATSSEPVISGQIDRAFAEHVAALERLATLAMQTIEDSPGQPVFPSELEKLADEVLVTRERLQSFGPSTPGFEAAANKHLNSLREASQKANFWLYTGGVANPNEKERLAKIEDKLQLGPVAK